MTWLGARGGQQIGNRLDARRRMRQKHQRYLGDARDADQILGGIKADFLVQRLVDRHGAAGHQQRVAVGRGARHEFAADVAAGASLVLHHHALAEFLGQRLGQRAGKDVGRLARWKRHDELDRLVGRPGGLGGEGGAEQAGGSERLKQAAARKGFHRHFGLWCLSSKREQLLIKERQWWCPCAPCTWPCASSSAVAGRIAFTVAAKRIAWPASAWLPSRCTSGPLILTTL